MRWCHVLVMSEYWQKPMTGNNGATLGGRELVSSHQYDNLTFNITHHQHLLYLGDLGHTGIIHHQPFILHDQDLVSSHHCDNLTYNITHHQHLPPIPGDEIK